jgi:hypothetical protein
MPPTPTRFDDADDPMRDRWRDPQVATCNLLRSPPAPFAQAATSCHRYVTVPAQPRRDDGLMVVSSVRTDIRVARFIRRFERRAESVADVVRAAGNFCDRSGLTRPSYEQIRLLAREARNRRERRRAAAQLLLEVDLRARPPSDLEYLLGDPRRAPRARRG